MVARERALHSRRWPTLFVLRLVPARPAHIAPRALTHLGDLRPRWRAYAPRLARGAVRAARCTVAAEGGRKRRPARRACEPRTSRAVGARQRPEAGRRVRC